MARAAVAVTLGGIDDLIGAIRNHGLYDLIRDARSLRLLMRSHVFAVWDFQSLLKALQVQLTCVEVPWLPTADPEARRFVNELVVDEESDICPWGGHLSHFELYRRAMVECGADVGPIDSLLAALRAGVPLAAALVGCGASEAVTRFVTTTLEVATSRSIHRIAAAFSLGREDVIPQMFTRLVDSFEAGQPGQWSTFRYYLERHIGNDADKHGPMARDLFGRLCGNSAALKAEALETARRCLLARIALWDDVSRQIIEGS